MTASLTDEPAVLAWRIALAPRPRHTTSGRHWWRDYVTDAFRSATHAWEAQAEAVAIGYATELAEFAARHPRPRLKDFMTHLSTGALAPDASGGVALYLTVGRFL